ncbi:phosphoenolpyruvate mutase [Mangrovihabitans endophyticus]|uniref:Phosphoenolpyruvate mutase n=1 Tax=Mangrovihabitans endophyticus TaxID=1751298 RepID=A0A8J3BZW8_9ACTN|nr:phosphoenolpyruvate mutase [Mangrovihabitans endophyticus]
MPSIRGAARLRQAFDRPGPVRIAGAHNPLGARLAERAGFDGVWSSGLEISASHGVPDADILTMSELLAVARSMAMAVDLPVVADCDAGYGNANNVMHMVRQYEAAGIAAVSIEDKPFPKLNSFVPGRQELVPIDEFAGKIAAAKAAQSHPDLMVIARIEALIAGWGMAEALRRGHAYVEAGADAVLIHAKGDSPEPIMTFLQRWRLPVPVVVVPTTYHTVTADELHRAGARMVIYANQGLRASIAAVSETFAAILRDGRTTEIEPSIAPLSTVFDLQGVARLQEQEDRFLHRRGQQVRAVMVSGARTAPPLGVPGSPASITIAGSTVLERQAGALRRADVQDISACADVAGAAAAGVTRCPADTAEALASLGTQFSGRTVVTASDVLFDPGPLRQLLAEPSDIAVLVDVGVPGPGHRAPDACGVTLDSWGTNGRRICGDGVPRLTALGVPDAEADAEFAGAAVLSAKGFAALHDAAVARRAGGHPCATLAELLADLVAAGWPVHAVEIASGWAELRTADDLRRVSALLTRDEA